MAIAELTTDTMATMFAKQLENHIRERIRDAVVEAIEDAKNKVVDELTPSIREYVMGIMAHTELYRVHSTDRLEIHVRIDGVTK